MKIAINGAGIGGPTLAWWLSRQGHEVLLLEKAAGLRSGGYVIDFWGLGFEVAEKMGIIPQVMEAGYQVGEVRFVNDEGDRSGGFSTHVLDSLTDGRFTSLRRSDLSRILFEKAAPHVETIFGTSIAAIEPGTFGLDIELENGVRRRMDMVVGADGLHSRVRHLAFGPQWSYEVPMGYHVAACEVQGYPHRDEGVYLSHARPGRQISRFSLRDDRTLFLFVFLDKFMPEGEPHNDQDRRQILQQVFDHAGWEWREILDAVHEAENIYFDRVSQIRMDHWSQGRTVLLGDAAASVSLLAGEGTGLAMTEAYVLAGELKNAGGDFLQAFDAYQRRLRPILQRKQLQAEKFASSFAPETALGLGFRNLVTRLLQIPAVAELFLGQSLHDDLKLPEYGAAASAAAH